MVLSGVNCQYLVLYQVQFITVSITLPIYLNGRRTPFDENDVQGYRKHLVGDLANQIDGISNLHYARLRTWGGDSFSPTGLDPGCKGQKVLEVGVGQQCLRRSSLGLGSPVYPRKGGGLGLLITPLARLSSFRFVGVYRDGLRIFL